MLCSGRKASAFCDWHWCHPVLRLTLPSLLLPRSHNGLITTHTSCWQQPSDRTKDATNRPNPKVGSWSVSRQRSTRPGQRLSIRWTVTVNIAVKCRKSLSCKANYRQLSVVNCTQLVALILNGWRHTARKYTRQQQQQHPPPDFCGNLKKGWGQTSFEFPVSALTLRICWQEGYPACKICATYPQRFLPEHMEEENQGEPCPMWVPGL